jgi:hypothetical protein
MGAAVDANASSGSNVHLDQELEGLYVINLSSSSFALEDGGLLAAVDSRRRNETLARGVFAESDDDGEGGLMFSTFADASISNERTMPKPSMGLGVARIPTALPAELVDTVSLAPVRGYVRRASASLLGVPL